MSTILSQKAGGMVTTYEVANSSTAKQKFSFGKGERFRHDSNYYEVDHRNGDFVLWKSASHGTRRVLWRASDHWEAPPGPNVHDFYAKVTNNAYLQLVGIDYTTGPVLTEAIYYQKDLGSVGATCFTIELDPGSSEYILEDNDIVAVPC